MEAAGGICAGFIGVLWEWPEGILLPFGRAADHGLQGRSRWELWVSSVG